MKTIIIILFIIFTSILASSSKIEETLENVNLLLEIVEKQDQMIDELTNINKVRKRYEKLIYNICKKRDKS